VLLVRGREGDTFVVGDVVVWLGDTPDEAVQFQTAAD
jgi:hypothetical protein